MSLIKHHVMSFNKWSSYAKEMQSVLWWSTHYDTHDHMTTILDPAPNPSFSTQH